jgi:hypothetical protein
MPDILQERLAEPFGRKIACVHCRGVLVELSGITRFSGWNTDLLAPGKYIQKKVFWSGVYPGARVMPRPVFH